VFGSAILGAFNPVQLVQPLWELLCFFAIEGAIGRSGATTILLAEIEAQYVNGANVRGAGCKTLLCAQRAEETAMQEQDVILKRQKYNTRFKNGDMDFMFNWALGVSQIVGMSPSQVFYAVHDIRDGDPDGWRDGFWRQGDYQIERAREFLKHGQQLAAGQLHLGAAYAYRSALQYTHPSASDFNTRVQTMERAFQQGVHLIGIPMRPIEIPFEHAALPGYYLEHDEQLRPVVMMVGGGDTFREDLFYFAGYPGWKRGYNVVMVDLPGQGVTPDRGLHFRADMERPISAVLDWLEAHSAARPRQIAIYGVSGGGYTTALAVSSDPRISAWIASTPIFDLVEVFQREFGSAMKAPGWVINTFMRLAGMLNKSAEINLDKYAWQFGATDFKSVVDGVVALAKRVDYTGIATPSLFLMSEGEGDELKRQTLEIYHDFRRRGVDVTLCEFTAAEGADGHCQVNNLRLAHLVIFDWLDRMFGHTPGDRRLWV
jgi:pimeloyl-ACP methyl ester carboxylesterase